MLTSMGIRKGACAALVLAMVLVGGCSRPLRETVAATPMEAAATASATPDAQRVETATLAVSPTPYDGRERLILTEEESRDIRLYVPSTYNPAQSTALVVNLHGFGSDPDGQWALSGMSAKAEEEGFIVVYPLGRDNQWYDGPGPQGDADVHFLRLLIRHLSGRYEIDPKRVYVTGMSNGGGMTNRMGCDAAEVVAAIGPVAGAYNFWETCSPSRPVPVVAFHGLDDSIVPYEGAKQTRILPPIHEWVAAWAERNGCDATPGSTEVNDTVTQETWGNCQQGADVVLYTLEDHGHSWPGSDLLPEITSLAINATDIIWEFFMAHPMP